MAAFADAHMEEGTGWMAEEVASPLMAFNFMELPGKSRSDQRLKFQIQIFFL